MRRLRPNPRNTGRNVADLRDHARPGHRFGLALLAASLVALLSVVAAPSGANAACPSVKPVTVPLPDPVSGRRYEIFVSLPSGYADNPGKTYPLLVLADGGRAFPNLSCEVRALGLKGAIGEEPIVVGLSYAAGEDLEDSRRRDYTPVAQEPSNRVYGGAAAYQAYLRTVVLRHVESHYRTDPGRRLFWGHSYGGLLGAHILLTEPGLFQTYLIGSPSFWFADQAIFGFEDTYAKRNRRLDATVLLYVGGLEISRYDPARKGNTRDMVAGMQAFASRLLERGYGGLQLRSTVIPGKDHRSSVRPGFVWALTEALASRSAGSRWSGGTDERRNRRSEQGLNVKAAGECIETEQRCQRDDNVAGRSERGRWLDYWGCLMLRDESLSIRIVAEYHRHGRNNSLGYVLHGKL
jgi:uncharacterized protein